MAAVAQTSRSGALRSDRISMALLDYRASGRYGATCLSSWEDSVVVLCKASLQVAVGDSRAEAFPLVGGEASARRSGSAQFGFRSANVEEVRETTVTSLKRERTRFAVGEPVECRTSVEEREELGRASPRDGKSSSPVGKVTRRHSWGQCIIRQLATKYICMYVCTHIRTKYIHTSYFHSITMHW